MRKLNWDRGKIVIFCDFDGTITQTDTLVYLLDNYGAKDWWDIERSLIRGEINEQEALKREIETLEVGWEEALDDLKQAVKIDPGFESFLRWTKSKSIPLIVLSGGFEEISWEYLSSDSYVDVEIRANRVEVRGKRWEVIPSERRRIRGRCNHCKSSSVVDFKQQGYVTIYIGDGTTDRCPASYADIVFAKDDLAEYCLKEGWDFILFSDFSEALEKIKRMMNEEQASSLKLQA